MTDMSMGSGRPDFGTLVDWVEGRLAADLAAEIARIVADADDRTRCTVDWLRGFLATAESMPLHTPPSIVRQRLRQDFQQWHQARSAPEAPRITLHAESQFDSRHHQAASGMRSGHAGSDTVHLAYTTEAADIVLDIRRLGDRRVRIEGQVMLVVAGESPVFAATASGPGFVQRTIDGDELGRFCLPELPDAVDHVVVDNGELAIAMTFDIATEP